MELRVSILLDDDQVKRMANIDQLKRELQLVIPSALDNSINPRLHTGMRLDYEIHIVEVCAE